MRDRVKRSFWCIFSLLLLVDTCTGALLDRRRSSRGVEGNLGNMVQQFLQSDDQTQLNYVRHGLDFLEDGVNGSLGELVDREGAQDRIFLGSVQSLITALQSILNDPSQTPTALAALATDPSNILTLITLMISTAFAAQLSAFTLFGDPESSTNRGLIGLVMDFLTSGMENVGDDMENTSEDMEDGDMEGEDGDMEEEVGDTENEESEGESEDGMENSDMENSGDGDMEDTEDARPGLLEALVSFLTGIFGGNNDNDGMEMESEGEDMAGDVNIGDNGGMENSEETEEEGSGTDDERQEDMMENDATDGGSSFGGLSVSLHPIDLAALFVQVQSAIGMNCTCADGAMTDEMITNATLRLVEEKQRKKTQKFKKVLNKTENKKKKLNIKKKKSNQETRKRVPKTA